MDRSPDNDGYVVCGDVAIQNDRVCPGGDLQSDAGPAFIVISFQRPVLIS